MMQMKCAWQELLSVLPPLLRPEVDALGKDTMHELRLRLGHPPELVFGSKCINLTEKVYRHDLQFVINTASKYSPWLAESMSQGYLTAPGGHRIGVCGEAVMKDGRMTGIRNISSLCIRVARDFPGMIRDRRLIEGSVLIIGKPGSGKTTFLRDLIRLRSDAGMNSVAVVDERGEIFPEASNFISGPRTDVLTGCRKREGLEIVLRTMGPETIAVDEITSEADCEGLLHVAWCGVSLIATAHAEYREDLFSRAVYRPLLDANVFDILIILQRDKSWIMERMECT
jgi:stage III sporulation protein AA